jgi:hypothetical protein
MAKIRLMSAIVDLVGQRENVSQAQILEFVTAGEPNAPSPTAYRELMGALVELGADASALRQAAAECE